MSAGIAAAFGAHAQAYRAFSAHAAAFHNQFVGLLNAGASGYLSAGAANASPLQTVQHDVLKLIDGPSQLLTGRPLIGDGGIGGPGTGGAGGHGGLLSGQTGRPGPESSIRRQHRRYGRVEPGSCARVLIT